MIPPDDVHILQRRFDEFEALTDAARGWEMGSQQLDRGSFLGGMEMVSAGQVTAIRCKFNRKLHHSEPARSQFHYLY